MSLSKRTVSLLTRARDLLMKEKDKYPKTIKALDRVLATYELEAK